MQNLITILIMNIFSPHKVIKGIHGTVTMKTIKQKGKESKENPTIRHYDREYNFSVRLSLIHQSKPLF